MADRIAQIDGRLNEIGNREQATQNEQLLILLAQERLALTNERISLTLPQAQGIILSCEFYLTLPSHIFHICILFAFVEFNWMRSFYWCHFISYSR